MASNNNPPEVLVPLAREDAEALEKFCEENIATSLNLLGIVRDKNSAVLLVNQIESMKRWRAAVKKGLSE